MGFAFSPSSCCSGGCTFASWAVGDDPAGFLATCTILEGSHWQASGGFVRWNGSTGGGSTGRLLLPGASINAESFVRLAFLQFPGGDNDSIVRVYPDTGSTPGPIWAEVRAGAEGHSTVTGAESKEVLFPWEPDDGAVMEVCVQKQPNGGAQYYITLAFQDATVRGLTGAEALTDIITETPTGRGVIIEVTSTADVIFTSITAQNHQSGATTCVDCAQDCGCPSCTMTVTVGGIGNDDSATYTCADDGKEDTSASICGNANRQYTLPGYNMPYTGASQCFWLACLPILTDVTGCHALIVVRMAFDPPSGETTVTAFVGVVTDACGGECAIATNVTSLTEIIETMQTCGSLCSTAVFSASSESGGNRVNCGFLEGLELTLDPTNPIYASFITDGSCCSMSGTSFAINTVGFDCGDSAEAPLVIVYGKDSNVVGCSSTEPSTDNGTDFGVLDFGDSATQTFSITNLGTEDLVIGPVSISGSSDFTLSGGSAGTIAPSATETFDVTFTPSAPTIGCPKEWAWLEFNTNVFSTPLCWFAVNGQVTSGEVSLADAGANVIDDRTTPTTTNHTDFGTVAIGSGVSNTFTIKNTGTNELALGVLTVTGTAAGDFTVTAQPGSTLLAAGSSTTFTVEFAPLLSGTRTATILIPSSCCDQTPFSMFVQGEATGAGLDTPPTCPFGDDTASLTIIGVGPSPCPGCAGTYDVPFNIATEGESGCTACQFSNSEPIPSGICDYNITIDIEWCPDSDGNPATWIVVNVTSAGGFVPAFNWNCPALGTVVAGSSPLVLSGYVTTISSLSLGSPTEFGDGSCDLSTITGTLTIS